MYNFENIEKALKEFGFNELYKNEIFTNSIDAYNNIIKCHISLPHEGNHNKFMIRMSTNAAFDRWANSVPIEEFFETEDEMVEWIGKSKEKIYYDLLEYLSEEYIELKNEYYGRIES